MPRWNCHATAWLDVTCSDKLLEAFDRIDFESIIMIKRGLRHLWIEDSLRAISSLYRHPRLAQRHPALFQTHPPDVSPPVPFRVASLDPHGRAPIATTAHRRKTCRENGETVSLESLGDTPAVDRVDRP